MLGVYIYRRHLRTCRYAAQGRSQNHRCGCPIWTDGPLDGRRYNRSLRTGDWPAAQEKLRGIERGTVVIEKPLREAYDDWRAQLTVQPSTREKYERAVAWFGEQMESRGVRVLSAVRVEDVDAWRTARGLSRGTLARELQTIRLFFRFAQRRRWLGWNPAEFVKITQARGRQVQPYSAAEVKSIIEATGRLGVAAYERLRARALVLLLRHTALRLGDALKLERARVQAGELMVYTEKAGTPVWLPIPPELSEALEALPMPRGVQAGATCEYYFWNGRSKPKTLKNDWDRTLRRVFAVAGVLGAHAHRFRHTLAVNLLGEGATLEEIARVLGNTPAVVARHYAPWCAALQVRVRELLQRAQAADNALLHPSDTAKSEAAKQWKQ